MFLSGTHDDDTFESGALFLAAAENLVKFKTEAPPSRTIITFATVPFPDRVNLSRVGAPHQFLD